MITIWPYLRLSVGFQGHFQVSLGGERRMSSFLSHSGRSPGDPRSQLSKNLPTASLLPLFLSFSPCSTTSTDPSIGNISILHRIFHANTKPNFIQSRLGQQKTASPSPLSEYLSIQPIHLQILRRQCCPVGSVNFKLPSERTKPI